MKQDIKARFDIRLSKEQKEIFEHAARISGFKSLTDFIISATQKETKLIIDKHNTLLASQKDQKIFFEAILRADEPNELLKKSYLDFENNINQ